MLETHELSIEVRSQPKNDEIIICGKFNIPLEMQTIPLMPTDIFKHLVCVVTRNVNYQVIRPFHETYVFDDDLKIYASDVSGNFNFNLMDHLAFCGEGSYYVLCSIGVYTSNIIKISVPKDSSLNAIQC